jgi:hypothetical protein
MPVGGRRITTRAGKVFCYVVKSGMIFRVADDQESGPEGIDSPATADAVHKFQPHPVDVADVGRRDPLSNHHQVGLPA